MTDLLSWGKKKIHLDTDIFKEKMMWRHGEEMAIYNQREKSQKKPTLPVP